MENSDLLRRLADLSRRCEKDGIVTASVFLTPAERFEAEHSPEINGGPSYFFCGGYGDAERTVCFFVPYYMEADEIQADDYISCIRLKAHFGEPGHRDYLGAVIGMGIGRERVGDILVNGDEAVLFCVNSVSRHLLGIDKVGKYSVSAELVPISEANIPERKLKEVSFSVASLRLDSVVAGMFHLSRTEAARRIACGEVSLNYTQCMKTDVRPSPGDIVSVRHAGKGKLTGTGGTSRKGRLFVSAEVYE